VYREALRRGGNVFSMLTINILIILPDRLMSNV